MRRLFPILVAILVLTIVFWKFSNTEPSGTKHTGTNSTAMLKTLLKPKVARRSVEQSPPSTNAAADQAEEPTVTGLSADQIAAYLLKYKRNAESLLTAFAECQDKALLKEAAEKFPNDPRVQLAMLMQDKSDSELTSEERNLWLERFKKSSPDNGLPNLLTALNNLKEGQKDIFVAEIMSSNAKPGLSAFYVQQMQSREEMYLSAGLSPREAAEKALQVPDVSLEAHMKALAQRLGEMQKDYLAAGDGVAANKIAALGVNLGHRWADPNSSPFVISEMVGIAIQQIPLKNLDPNTYYDFLGKTAAERIAELKAERGELKVFATDLSKYYVQMSESDRMIYMNRLKMYGERGAWKWLQQTYGTNGGAVQP
ncbi:MAG: hypothetical protein JWM68_2331 [Verrucomicrobiales bacterium]|nr:hypothetical protein [Verrucomicrobiales bacterium]